MNDAETSLLISWLDSVRDDPLAFVLGAFPWGEPGPLANAQIEAWQHALLCDIRDGLVDINTAIKIATASGHGIGKSACVSWIILWAFTTLPDTKGVVTANTENQLKTKTWAELGRWFNRFVGREHFQLTATALLSRDPSRERTWRIDQVPWSEKNTEAFQGLHNYGLRLLLIFDEGSAIPDLIWETAEGAMTDKNTQLIWLVFGNPTRATGRFRECFRAEGHGTHWRSQQIDSRTVSITNREEIDRWEAAYGEDSDFFRVRVKGMFPRVGEMEFISEADIDAAMAREPVSNLTDPLALGVDVARYGKNKSVIFVRKGRDASTIPAKIYTGLSTVELALRVLDTHNEVHSDGIFIDGGGVGGGVVDSCRSLALECFDIQFGAKDDVRGQATGNLGEVYANKRAAMWGALRAWIKVGSLPKDADLKKELLAPRYGLNASGAIQLESKEDMMRRGALREGGSPDQADALALTFAYPLQPKELAGGLHARGPEVAFEYDPFSSERMSA